MAGETPRLGLSTFEQGDEEWSHTDTVEAVDKNAIARGSIADRPDQGDYDDELYHATDQRITWRWDADAGDWNAISGLGSSDQPVPGTSHFSAVNADEATIGSTPVGRPFITNSSLTLTFGSDFSTNSELASQLPIFCRHDVTIDMGSGDSTFDLLLPAVYRYEKADATSEAGAISVAGDESTPSNCPLNSVYVSAASGRLAVDVAGVEITGSNPIDDESVGVAFYGGSSESRIRNVIWSGGTNGLLAYGTDVMIAEGNDFGSNVLSGDAIRVKHGGSVAEEYGASTPAAGQVGGYAYANYGGEIRYAGTDSTLDGDNGTVNPRDGKILDYQNQTQYGQERIATVDGAFRFYDDVGGLDLKVTDRVNGKNRFVVGTQGDISGANGQGKVYLGLRSSPPHSASGSGDTYPDDGTNTSSGNPEWRVDDPADSTWKDMN